MNLGELLSAYRLYTETLKVWAAVASESVHTCCETYVGAIARLVWIHRRHIKFRRRGITQKKA